MKLAGKTAQAGLDAAVTIAARTPASDRSRPGPLRRRRSRGEADGAREIRRRLRGSAGRPDGLGHVSGQGRVRRRDVAASCFACAGRRGGSRDSARAAAGSRQCAAANPAEYGGLTRTHAASRPSASVHRSIRLFRGRAARGAGKRRRADAGRDRAVSAAVFAGQGTLNIGLVIACAALAAILGDNAGYWVGREFGFPLVYKYGSAIRVDEGTAESRAISFSAPWRQDRVLRPLCRDIASFRRVSRRRQSSALAALSAIQRARRRHLGDDLRPRRLFPRPGLRTLRAAGRPRRRCCARSSAPSSRHRFVAGHEAALRAEAEAALPGPLVSPKKG